MSNFENEPKCSYQIKEFFQGKDILQGIILLSYDAPKGSNDVSFQLGLVKDYNVLIGNFSWKYFIRLNDYPTTLIYLKEFVGIMLLSDTQKALRIATKLYARAKSN